MNHVGISVRAVTACLISLTVGGCILYGRVAFSPDGRSMASVVLGDWPGVEATGVGGRPPAVSDSPDDTTAGTAEPPRAPYELWITDLATGEHRLVARKPYLGASPSWSADGRELWFLRGDVPASPILTRWDGTGSAGATHLTTEGRVKGLLTTPPQVLPDGKSILLTRTLDGAPPDQGVVRVELESGRELVLARRAAGAVLSPLGDRFVCYTWADGRPDELALGVFPVGGGECVRIASLHGSFGSLDALEYSPLAWSPDGRFVAWTDVDRRREKRTTSTVHVADSVSGAIRFVSPAEESAILPLFAVGSDEVYYAASGMGGDPGRTVRVDLATGEVRDVPGGEACVPAGLSLDGRRLALRRYPWGPRKGWSEDDMFTTVIRVVSLETGEFRDDWVNARQHRVFAAAEVERAEEAARTLEDALGRAQGHLDEIAKRFPGAPAAEAVTDLRRRLATLRALGPEGPR